jgi:photosystem II stability/assembly factor-like uncharacterized protein
MHAMTFLALRRRAALAALVLAAACTDRTPTHGPLPPAVEGEGVGMQIACTASVAAKQVRCGTPAPAPSGGASSSIIVGGQGTYLQLETSGAAYDSAAHVFSMGAAVRNLLAQQMGTPDGKAVAGVRVIFDQEPVATEGGGEITVANADGEASFTRSAQPYFDYPQIVEAGAVSQPRTWRFNVPPAVRTFHFTVYVRTELPAEQGGLRWVQEYGPRTADPMAFSAVWGASRDHVFAVGNSTIWSSDSTGWVPMARAPISLRDIWGVSRDEVYAVGERGLVMRYDGNRWETRRPASDDFNFSLDGVWSDGYEVWAVGVRYRSATGPQGVILHSRDDGVSWDETPSSGGLGGRILNAVLRAGSSLYVVGYQYSVWPDTMREGGVLLRSTDGGATWSDSVLTGGRGLAFYSVWADGPGDVYIGGKILEDGGERAIILHSTDGGATWSRSVQGRGAIRALWRVPGGRLYAVGRNHILVHQDGTWRAVQNGCQAFSRSWAGVWGSAEDDLHFVAIQDANGHFDGTRCRRTSPFREQLYAVSASGTSLTDPEPFHALAVGTRSGVETDSTSGSHLLILRSDGDGVWREEEYRPDLMSGLVDVWAGPPGVAVGWIQEGGVSRSLILRRVAGRWEDVTPASARGMSFGGVWGSASTGEVYAFALRQTEPYMGLGRSETYLIVYRSKDGATWSEAANLEVPYFPGLSMNATMTGAWGSGSGALYVAGTRSGGGMGDGFLASYDGLMWSVRSMFQMRPLSGVWSSGDTVVTSGARFVERSVDGGGSWTRTELPLWTGPVWGSSADAVYVLGIEGSVHFFDGVKWSTMRVGNARPSGDARPFREIGGWRHNVYVIGSDGAIFRLTR